MANQIYLASLRARLVSLFSGPSPEAKSLPEPVSHPPFGPTKTRKFSPWDSFAYRYDDADHAQPDSRTDVSQTGVAIVHAGILADSPGKLEEGMTSRESV